MSGQTTRAEGPSYSLAPHLGKRSHGERLQDAADRTDRNAWGI